MHTRLIFLELLSLRPEMQAGLGRYCLWMTLCCIFRFRLCQYCRSCWGCCLERCYCHWSRNPEHWQHKHWHCKPWVVTAIGRGILRDACWRNPQSLLKKSIAVAGMIGIVIFFYFVISFGVNVGDASVIAIAATIRTHLVAIKRS